MHEAAEELQEGRRAALKQLSFAQQVVRMYPRGSGIVDRALEGAERALRECLHGRDLELTVYPTSLGWRGDGGEQEIEAPELARRLHGRGIAVLRLGGELSRATLGALLVELAVRREELAADREDPILAGGIAGVEAELLRLEHLFEGDGGDAPEKSPADRIWEQILRGFQEAHPRVGAGGLATDPQGLQRLVAWVLDVDGHPPDLASYSAADLLRLVLEQAAGSWGEATAASLTRLAGTFADVYEQVDPETWMELLEEPLPVMLGVGDERTAADLAQAVAAALSGAQVEELIDYAVTTRSGATPRLYGLFRRLLSARRDRRALADRVVRRAEVSARGALADAWPRFLEVLRGEEAEPFIDSDYRTAMGSGATLGRPRVTPALRARFPELEPESIRVSLGRVATALLARERDGDTHAALLESLERVLPVMLREGDLTQVEELVSTLRAQSDDGSRPEDQRQGAARLLDELADAGSVTLLLHRLDGDGTDFYALWRVLEGLGETCLPQILDALENHVTPQMRYQLCRILGSMSPLPLEELGERLGEASPGFAVQLISALASLVREELAPFFRDALGHDNPDVRRVAVEGLCQLPPRVVEADLLRALDDPVLDVRVAALRGFRTLLSDGSVDRLHAYLELSNWHGRNTGRIRAAIMAARHLAGPGTIERLEKLCRKPILFRRRRRPVWVAARETLARLRARDDLDPTTPREATAPRDTGTVAA